MSDTEIRMLRYTVEQLSAELQATRQYVSDMEPKLERTRKALDVAMGFIEKVRNNEDTHIFWIKVANDTIDKITALEQKDVK